MRLLTIIALALLAAACGSSPNSPGTNQSSQNPGEAPFRFAACMRDHGVTNFPDPQVTTTTTPGGSAVGVKMVVPASTAHAPKFKTAQKACQGILPAPGSRSEHHRPSKRALLAFAQCLRTHGISNFPDPNAQGELTPEMINASGIDVRGPAFFAAAKSCVGVTHGQITLAAVERAINKVR
jgi:hypothetical protein